jgi:transmembrane sensor
LIIGLTLMGVSNSGVGTVFSTAVGGFDRVLLDDGSVAELTTNSEIRVRLAEGRRDIQLLRGEAHFKVAHDPERPFVVTAARTTVQALGTEFDVRMYERNRVSVLVTEGRVAVTGSGTASREVNAGELAMSKAGRINVTTADADEIARRLAWRTGWLWFSAQPIREVVSEFNRYSERRLVIVDPELADKRISGRIRLTGVDQFLSALEGYGVRATAAGPQENVVRLHGEPR